MESRKKLKIVVFGSRHTGQGPLGRAWGRTDADLPDLQPVVIYERDVETNGQSVTVTAWILSLDPQFEYMRQAMCMKADGFIYTFDVSDITGKSLQYIDPFVDEARTLYDPMPPEILVGSVYDPTWLKKPAKIDQLVNEWLERHGASMPFFELDLTNKDNFFAAVEQVFEKMIGMIAEN
ncbi:MAG TPA: hypothetical protein VKM55_28470 [Candidatus Lokiarchaeia archaeon]|nr:hypothetical protein [Candidatus Lokiarchaeia archaeon]